MMTYNEFKSRWDSMPVFGYGYLRVDSEHLIDFNIGYADIGQKTLMILNAYQVDILPSSESIIADNIVIDQREWAILFRLIHRDNEEVFMRLCWDIIESSRDVEDEPISFVVNRYLKWQKLLTQTRPEIMTVSRQKGLFGELIYLSEMIEKFGAEKAIMSWSGPEGSDQDFVYDNTWVEVKSIALASVAVSISSLEQLEIMSEGLLIVYRIEKTTIEDTNGKSLNDLVSNLRLILLNNKEVKEHFEFKLYLYGFKDSIEYSKINYKYFSEMRYLVTDEFPKLTKLNIPTQITFAKYGISLNAIEPFRQ